MQQNYNKKRKLNKLKASLLMLMMVLFAGTATAQNNVYMHSGTQNVTQTLNFYDSGGPESTDGSYFWEKQYKPSENATLTFKDGNNKIQITFKTFQGWSDTGWPDYTLLDLGTDWSARLNDDDLYIYDGESADDNNLLVHLTGNIKNEFTITANGPLTVKFVSNARYNGEGWSAEVKSVTTAGINKPIVSKDECGDFVNILNPNLEGTVYYTTTGNAPTVNDPLQGTELYDGPFAINLDDENASVTVMAIVYYGPGQQSAVTTLNLTHEDQRPTPGVPTVTISGNTVTMKPATNPGLDETYNVVYTTDGSEPTATNGTVITTPWAPIEWHTPNVTFKVATIAVKANCNSLVSAVVTEEFGDVTIPTPVITFDANGNASITCAFDEATIYYTIDGSEPNVSNVGNNGPTYIYSAPFAVTPGTTVKAYANYAADGYLPSAVASQVYVPAGGNNVYGTVVLLDDREDHSWSYYSDGTQPIHSLNPADVKITYYGNGTDNMTSPTENGTHPTSFSEDATGVYVNHDALADQFIYLKTLEKDETSGNYPYTMIPNPFQVRPVYTPSNKGNEHPRGNRAGFETVCEDFESYSSNASSSLNPNGGGSLPTGWTYEFTYNNGTNYRPHLYNGDYAFDGIGVVLTYYRSQGGWGGNTTYPSTLYTTIALNEGDEVRFESSVQNTNGVLYYGYTNGSTWTQIGTATTATSQTVTTFTVPAVADGQYLAFRWTRSSGNGYNSVVIDNICVTSIVAGVPEAPVITPGSGIYASTQTVTISDVYSVDNSTFYYTLDGSDPTTSSTRYTGPFQIAFAENTTKTLKVIAVNAHGTSPVSEAVYVFKSGVNNNSYYRGFYAWRVKSLSSGLSIKVDNTTTYTSNNINANSIIYADQEIEFVAEANSKDNEVEFEALWAQAYVNSSTYVSNGSTNDHPYYQNAYERNFKVVTSSTSASSFQNSYPCTISSRYPDGTSGGGSLTGGFTAAADTKIENIAVSSATNSTWSGNGHNFTVGRGVTGTINTIQGLSADATTDFNLRIESGTYNYLYFMGSNGLTSGGKLTAVLGSDYDRAKKVNTTPKVNTDILLSNEGTVGSSGTIGTERFHCTVKSGNFDLGTYGQSNQFYISSPNGNMYASRTLIVEGGIFSDISGGIDYNGQTTTNLNQQMVNIRIKGGNIKGAVFGAAQFSGANGHRRMVFTGGTVDAWIAGGCNGTRNSGGELYGNTYIYFGGKAEVGNENGGTHAGTTNTQYGTNGADGGIIFGAGCGILPTNGNYQSNTVGRVNNSNIVIADEAIVWRELYGGGNYGFVRANGTTDIQILGGTVKGNVYGGSNSQVSQTVSVTMKNGTVNGNIYGGSNSWGANNNGATVNVSGGTVTNVFGGGLGSSTSMAAGTVVNISGGTINNNVYGGGEQGSVTGSTVVSVSGGTMNDVYGAGLGTEYSGTWPPTAANANISGTTTVNVSGGTMANVYGGGENGSVAWSSTPTSTSGSSTVNISNGEVTGTVYGGGKMGTTQGTTTVNVSGGIVRGNVFAGAYGKQQQVFVTGLRTLNITGGHIYSHVYGGSRNANDGGSLSLANSSFSSSNVTTKMCVTNISGGTLDENVYAAGYFGNCFGSVYAFIGQNAINNAPNATPTTGITYSNTNLNIGGTIWAGGDWGTFTGTFGGNTISGNSNIYVDGTDYETETTQTSNAQYFNIGGSVLGCGTSCHAGKGERTIIIRNYGYANGTAPEQATRTLFSVQFAKILIFDNANINFAGQGRINSLVTTEKYSIYEIYDDTKTTNTDTDVDGVRVVNGSGLFLNAPATQLANFRSMSCPDVTNNGNTTAGVYASTNLTGYTAITPTTLQATPNKVRVNNGTFVEVKYGSLYGPLIGYAYMMVSTNDADATCAYARPKNCYVTPITDNLNNANDGGWVSYTASENTFNLDGSAAGTIQMPYENHTVAKNGEQYFRIWRAGGIEHYREGVFDAAANGTATFSFVDVVITLPAFRSNTAYYRFETVGDEPNMNTTVDYGSDVLTFNSALVGANSWISYNEDQDIEQATAIESAQNQIIAQPDVNFGLVAINGQGMGLITKEGSATSGFIICNDSDPFLAEMTHEEENDPYYYVNKFPCSDNTKTPQVTFRLTYYNKLSANMTWDPMNIVLVQCDASGNVTDRVKIALAVNTSASIEQEFTTDVYAVMQGKGSSNDTYTAKVVLPKFSLYTSGVESNFTLNSVTFVPENGGNIVERGSTGANAYNYNNFAIMYGSSLNYDNTDGWNGLGTGEHDTYPMTLNNPSPVLVGKAGGREEFAIDFTLIYDGGQTHTGDKQLMGTLTYNITFDNYKDSNGNLQNSQNLTIVVKVWRRGEGSKFYLDGVNGDNAYPKDVLALYPNRAAKSLNTIFNRCGYLAGDEIYVVNKVTANNNLIWNGLTYNNVTLYRYNGGHPLASGDGIVGNANNDSYKGEFLVANNKVSLRGITLDGYYEDPFANNSGNGKGDSPETSVSATAPLIVVGNGGTVELSKGTVLQNNNNSAGNGGAVLVNDGGTLKMNQDAQIKDNLASGDGAGVYMAGTMIVSDDIQIIDNKKGTTQNNVCLTAADKVITIGTAAATDEYDELSNQAKIGVTKELYGDVDGYTKVVNVEADVDWLETPYNSTPNAIIYHDLGKYQLEKYTDPTYLYWIGTWVTVQDWNPKYESAEVEGYNANNFDPSDINTAEELAWFISHVNGLNGADPHPAAVANITGDIDMSASIWVPIGSLTNAFQGTFEGNGHVIKGMRSPLVQTNMGMIGNAEGATVQNVIANVAFEANAANMGTLIGSMSGGTLSNVEAAGSLIGGSNTINMGGLVGLAQPITIEGTTTKPTIHSAFAVNAMTGTSNTVMGGLVGNNGGNLYNSYANTTMSGSTHMGGLVGVNNAGCTVENCYVVLGQQEMAGFAYTNNGTINYCYADKAGTQVADGESTGTVAKSGTYAAVKGRKELGYMYGDNIVTAPTANTYANHESITYLNNHTLVWNGLLSVLNQWVKDNPTYTAWLRPTSADINGDLPILAFPKDNSLGTIGNDKKFLQYAAFNLTEGNNFNNGIDGLLTTANVSNIFLYGNATNVVNVPATSTNVFINEDAVLLQKQGTKAGDFINTTVGITFDNSDHGQHAYDYYGNQLTYDWHFMSTPLSDASTGATYTEGTFTNSSPANISGMVNGYFPNNMGSVMWDFYTYYEPQYHWINLKRGPGNHWHTDGGAIINYEEADNTASGAIFIPGKGYMMAISQDSYMSSTGTLNNGNVTITLTNQEPNTIDLYNKGWNLVGNPYQAYLDLKEVGAGTYYIYDAESGVYVPYAVSASENTVTPSRYIHPHQGFFMYSASDGAEFTFKPSMATTEKQNGSYFRGNEQINYPLVNLFARNQAGNTDLAIIEFNRPEIGGATKVGFMTNANFSIAAHLDNESYGLLFTPEGTEKVPVHFVATEDGTYTLDWSTYNGDFTSLLLVDNMTGVITDMLRSDSYTFDASKDDYASRFYITYTVTDVDEYSENNGSFAFFDGSEWVVNGKGQLDIVDVTGRVLFSKRLANEQNRVNLGNVAPGVYMMRVTDGKNTMVQKIVVR